MRLIDADKLVEVFLLYPMMLGRTGDFVAVNLDAVFAEIRRAPTIDPESLRPQGEWEYAEDGDGLVCPSCGVDFCVLIYETERFNYCPNCGAKMKGETK